MCDGLAAGHFGAVEAAGNGDFGTEGAALHGVLDAHLHGAAEGNAALELAGDVLGDERSVGLGLLDLFDGDFDGAADELGEEGLELFGAATTATDDDTGLGGMDGDDNLTG